MNSILDYPFDSKTILRKRRTLKKQLLSGDNLKEKHIAILGGSTTHDIREILELFLLNYGFRPVFYESEYGQYWDDAVFENPRLKDFKPDIIFIHTSNRNIRSYPVLGQCAEEVQSLLEEEYQRFEIMWEKLTQDYHCPIIQNNFEYPFYRLLGNQDACDIHGRVNFITRLNNLFYTYAQLHEDFYINDINYQSADYGLKEWSDPFYWNMYKYALCVDAIPTLAYNVANVIKSLFGKNKKVLAVDLDNTLWGGVVGDDGVENLELGPETSTGQAFTEFQQYLKEQKKKGILLTVISKNDEKNALAGLHHPQMLLQEEDFVVIKANWETKSTNLLQIAEELSLLPDSFVFVDDNPAEREIVRQQVPAVAVPEITNVEHYIYELDRAGYFETTHLSSDDLNRNEMYSENIKRAQLQKNCSNYEEYLRSLGMKAEIQPFAPLYMSRIAQLTNKSNQFNLTTLRLTQGEIEQMAEDPSYITLYGKLLDNFGDNGVVSVVIGKQDGDHLDIILWLMSCRVLKRGMEYAMMDVLVKACQARNIKIIRGHYKPTAKNSMVKNFYHDQGFSFVLEDVDNNTVWELDISQGYEGKNHIIQIEKG